MIKTGRGKTETVFVMLIFCVFAASVLLVLMLSANVYKNMSDKALDGYDEQTTLSYIWTKVKNGDDAGMISVGDFYGITALSIYENFGGLTYQTCIYYYDGWVYELFYEVGLEMYPEDGIPVIKAESLTFVQLDSGLIKVTSGSDSLLISLRASALSERGTAA
jgi:hypothetical protein